MAFEKESEGRDQGMNPGNVVAPEGKAEVSDLPQLGAGVDAPNLTVDSEDVAPEVKAKVINLPGLGATAETVVTIEEAAMADARSSAKPKKPAAKPGFKTLMRILTYSTPLDRCMMAGAVICSAGAGAALPLMNILFGRLLSSFNLYFVPGAGVSKDTFLAGANRNALYIFILFLVRFALTYISIFTLRMTGIRISAAIRMAYLRALFARPISAIDRLPSGMATDQLTTTANTIQIAFSDRLGNLFQALAQVVSAVTVAFIYSWSLTLVSGSMILYVIAIFSLIVPFMLADEAKIQKNNLYAAGVAGDVMRAIRTVKALCAEHVVTEQYSRWVHEARRYGMKSAWTLAALYSQIFFPVYADMGLTFWFGIKLFSQGDIPDVSNVIIVLFSVILVVSVVGQILQPVENLNKAASCAHACFAIIDAPSQDQSGGKTLEHGIDRDIQFKDVHFAYPSRPEVEVLRGLNISFPVGKISAIVGPSGSGKSTVVGLMERWYQLSEVNERMAVRDPEADQPKSDLLKRMEEKDAKKAARKAAKEAKKAKRQGETNSTQNASDELSEIIIQNSGTILIGDENIEALGLRWWRSQIGLVQQEPFLFHDTIYANVAMGLIGSQFEDSTEEEKKALVEAACEEAYANEFIVNLPDGYETKVGESGIKLSGGQRQRIAIARSIIKRPPILILDEATSAIDVRGEAKVQKALDRVSQGRTTITIAHRLSTIKKADNIIVIRDGTCMESGTHEELMHRVEGAYAHLVNAQHLDLDMGEEKDGTVDTSEVAETNEKLADGSASHGSIDDDHGLLKGDEESSQRGFFRSMGLMLYEQRHLKLLFLGILLTSMGAGSTFALQAYIFSRFVTIFTETGQDLLNAANFWALMFFALSMFVMVCYAIIGFCSTRVSHQVATNYRLEYYQSILGKPISWFDAESHSSGTLTSRLSNDPQQLQQVLGTHMSMPLIALFNVLGCCIISFYFGWKLTLVVFFSSLPVILIASFVRLRFEIQFEELNNKVFAESSQFAAESINAFRTVSALTYEPVILRRYQTLLDEHVRKAFRTAPLAVLIFSIAGTIDLAAMALAFWYGSQLLASYEYNPLQFFVIYIAIVQGGQAAGQFLGVGANVANATAAANRVLNFRGTSEVAEDVSGQQHNMFERDDEKDYGVGIEFRNVAFRYPTRDIPVFRDLSFTIPSGSYVAFVGPSGCGKTTVISLLERFYDVTSGSITVGGQDLTRCSLGAYRRALALVSQEPTLFAGTVRENLVLGLPDSATITDQEVEDAARAAEIHDFIISLPQGYGTELVGVTHASLSGGQKQRLCIARALLRRPRLLLLDEATSSLDSHSERLVQHAIDRVAKRGNVTIVVVAHRLATVQNAERIIVLGEGGVIREQGSHAELVRRRGVYWGMCHAQALDR